MEWTVRTIEFKGEEYCVDCDCWHYLARDLISLIEQDRHGIAAFLNLERYRKIKEAQAEPQVNAPGIGSDKDSE